jgi:hypothetical protein
MDEALKCGLGFSPSNPNNTNEIHGTLDPHFTTDVLRLKFNQGELAFGQQRINHSF